MHTNPPQHSDELWFDVAKWFATLDNETALYKFFERLGILHNCDRVWLAKANAERTHARIIYEWRKPNITPTIASQVAIPIILYKWLSKRLRQSKGVQFNTADLPESRHKLWKILTKDGIQSTYMSEIATENNMVISAFGYHFITAQKRLTLKQRKETYKAAELLRAWFKAKNGDSENHPSHSISLFIKEGGSLTSLHPDKIISITGVTNYSRINITGRSSLLQHCSLDEWEEKLPSQNFMRIHRSHIINMSMIAKLDKNGGAWKITMSDKSILPVGRISRATLLKNLSKQRIVL